MWICEETEVPHHEYRIFISATVKTRYEREKEHRELIIASCACCDLIDNKTISANGSAFDILYTALTI